MLKIGFADYYLNNWHADHNPGFLRDVINRYGYDARVTHAFGVHEAPPEGGLTTAQWCAQRNIRPAENMEQLVDSVDAIMVIAADNSEWHEEVCQLPLRSGKPVFVDKTFAPSLAAGKRLFALAEEHGTPVFSSSAQRYCQDILDYQSSHTEKPRFVSTVGPHSLDSYAVHQLEPIVALMGVGVKRLKAFSVGSQVISTTCAPGAIPSVCTAKTPAQVRKGRGNSRQSISSETGATSRNPISIPMRTGWCCGIGWA